MEFRNLNSILLNDYIVHENQCNLRCQYCLGQEISEDDKKILNSDDSFTKQIKYTDNTDIKQTQDILERYINADIFQISGGELFVIEDIEKFIVEKSKSYEKVLVLTNGYLLNNKIIEQFAACNNITLAISLDGHTFEMNRYRFNSEKVLNKILDNIRLACKNEVPILINMVLHDKNIDYIKEFLYYLADISNNINVFPIILRGEASKKYTYNFEKNKVLLEIYEDKEIAKRLSIIPEYFKEMYHVSNSGYKSFKCYSSIFATETFHNGELFCCPLNWVKSMGNLLNDNPDMVMNKFGNDAIYKLFLKKSQSFNACKNCLSHYDIINMYIEDVIDLKTLKKISFLNTEKIIEKIEYIKKEVKNKWI